jgi:hypothetical protein
MRGVCILVSVLGAVGCTDAGRPLIILQNQVPNADCVVTATASASSRTAGVFDVLSNSTTVRRPGYLLFPLVQNLAARAQNDASLRLAAVRGMDVELEAQPGVGVPPRAFTIRFSGVIPAGALAAFAIEAVPGAYFDEVAATGILTDPSQSAQVTLRATIFADMDGTSVESEEFIYPIAVCNGCLGRLAGTCGGGTQGLELGTCGVAQDAPIDCCTRPEGGFECPAF